ncbi:MAG: 1-deoxy-D-xylulose-5-phosphate reductoisomerase, partial [Clostridia bacterium]|nr:1-deoxy-D-xylulose-5-phosphate reductoisomerase [Clostridia bacterium]
TALSYPSHGKQIIEPLRLEKVGSLTFSAPDYDRYPCLKLAIEAAKAGEGACIALSAADEILVEEYLKDKIKFTDIADTLAKVLNKFRGVGNVKLEDILSIDEKARKYTYNVIGVK